MSLKIAEISKNNVDSALTRNLLSLGIRKNTNINVIKQITTSLLSLISLEL